MTSSLVQPLSVLLPVLYMLSAILHGMAFGGRRAPNVQKLRENLFRATLLIHITAGVVLWRHVGHFPIDDTWSVLSAVALATALTYGWIARIVKHPGSGGIVLGVVFVMQLLASAFGDMRPPGYTAEVSTAGILHVTTSVVAASALLLSGLHGALYLTLFRELRRKQFGMLFNHLPDLSLLARMTRRSALSGFIFLAIGLNLGFFLAHRDHTIGFGYTDPHVLLTLFLWIHFGVVAFSGSIPGLSARRASLAASAGLVALVLALFVTLFPSITFHAGM